MAPRHADALRSMRRVYLDAGKGDEWFLDLGAQAFAAELDKLGVEHTLELFDGKHGGLALPLPGRDPRARAGATVDPWPRARSTSPTSRCPLTWVRTKLALERLAPGEELMVALPRRARRSRTCRARRAEAGHDVTVEGTRVRIVRR